MKRLAAATVTGLVFGFGLTISGMGNPAKVLGFLDVAGNWDPSLALVLVGATGVTILIFRIILKRHRPVLDSRFHLPTRTDVDPALVLGAGIFGIGWGIAGFCPGPVYTTLLQGRWETWVFFAAMIAGMAAFKFGSAYVSRRRNEVGVTGPALAAGHGSIQATGR
jgi:uncharacterized membrane protein YedE/YeeE